MELVARWAPIGLADALELLSPAFANPEVGAQHSSLLHILLSPRLLHWPTSRDELRSCRSQMVACGVTREPSWWVTCSGTGKCKGQGRHSSTFACTLQAMWQEAVCTWR